MKYTSFPDIGISNIFLCITVMFLFALRQITKAIPTILN